VKRKSYVGMKRLAENREDWRAATNQSLDWWPMMMMSNFWCNWSCSWAYSSTNFCLFLSTSLLGLERLRTRFSSSHTFNKLEKGIY
jgi:hypothetical protein